VGVGVGMEMEMGVRKMKLLNLLKLAEDLLQI
jgi:hypothetical protein